MEYINWPRRSVITLVEWVNTSTWWDVYDITDYVTNTVVVEWEWEQQVETDVATVRIGFISYERDQEGNIVSDILAIRKENDGINISERTIEDVQNHYTKLWYTLSK